MSTLSIDAVDASALNSSDLNLKDFSLEILNSKPFYAFEVPKFVIDTTIKVFSLGDHVLSNLCKGCETISSAENVLMFFQDMISMPSQLSKMKASVIKYVNKQEAVSSVLNQARKLLAFSGSSLGDYYFSCEALKELKVPVDRIQFVSEKAGLYGSSAGAASRIIDYISGDFEEDTSIEYPVSDKIRSPIVESRRGWDCARDVSILALSLLGVYFNGLSAIPATPVAVFSGVILGSRLVSLYKDLQLKKIDDNNPYKASCFKELKKI